MVKAMTTYKNPIVIERADPWVYKHTDGYYYFATNSPQKGYDPNDPNGYWYKEPFTTTIDPFTVYKSRYDTQTISRPYVTDNIPN